MVAGIAVCPNLPGMSKFAVIWAHSVMTARALQILKFLFFLILDSGVGVERILGREIRRKNVHPSG